MRARGFTLIEVVLALAILALVMGLAFGSFFAQKRVDRAARSEMEAGQAARVFMEQLLVDVGQALAPGHKGLGEPTVAGHPLQLGRFQGHELTLITRTDPETGDRADRVEPVVRLIYRTVPGQRPDGSPAGNMSVVRRIEPLLGEEAEEELICSDVTALRISYLDREAKESESWSDRKKLPLGLKVELELTPLGGTPKTYSLTCGPLTALTWNRTK